MGDDSGLILEIVRRTEQSLDNHIEFEEVRLSRINEKLDTHAKDITALEKSVALTQQRNGYINGVIAMIVAACVSWLASIFGSRG